MFTVSYQTLNYLTFDELHITLVLTLKKKKEVLSSIQIKLYDCIINSKVAYSLLNYKVFFLIRNVYSFREL